MTFEKEILLVFLSRVFINPLRRTLEVSYPPLSPIAPIQIAIAYGFGDVVALHFLAAFEVGDGAGYLQDAAVGTG